IPGRGGTDSRWSSALPLRSLSLAVDFQGDHPTTNPAGGTCSRQGAAMTRGPLHILLTGAASGLGRGLALYFAGNCRGLGIPQRLDQFSGSTSRGVIGGLPGDSSGGVIRGRISPTLPFRGRWSAGDRSTLRYSLSRLACIDSFRIS